MTTDYVVVDPSTNEAGRSYPTATADDIEAALASADTAHRDWSRKTSVEDRAALMHRASEITSERRDELAEIIVREMGKPLEEALEEIDFAAAIYGYYADNGPKFLADEAVDLMEGTGDAVVRRRSIGVLLGIMPWNFPFYQIARFAGPNMVAGNTIILKHAPQCPESAAVIEEIFHTAGFPQGAYVNVYATNDQCADIIADPRLQGVSLTGSEAAGAAVAEVAGRNLKKCVLELGGSDPFVLLSTDDMDGAVDAAYDARYYNTGQACNGGKRFIVASDIYDEFVSAFSAKVLATSADSPMSSLKAAENLAAQVEDAVKGGAELHTSGERDGAFYPPSVLTDVSTDSATFHQELFGPVAMVFKADSEEQAVSLANDTPFGLGSYVYTTDPEQAQRVADQLEVGMVFVNCVNADGAELMFGGVKRSGFGRELGRYGIEEFLNKKLIRTS